MTAPTSTAPAMPPPSPSPATTPLDPFLQACLERIRDLDQIAALMLWAALLLAVLTGAVAVFAAYKAATKQPDPPASKQADLTEAIPGVSPAVLEPLGKFLEVLSKLQVWFFLFLAGLALAWFASSISDGRCGNPAEAPAPVITEAGKAAPGKPALTAPTATAAP